MMDSCHLTHVLPLQLKAIYTRLLRLWRVYHMSPFHGVTFTQQEIVWPRADIRFFAVRTSPPLISG